MMAPSIYEPLITYVADRTYQKDYAQWKKEQDEKLGIATSPRLKLKQEPRIENGFAFLDIKGSISHLSSEFNAWCGMTSYQTIIQDMQDIVKDNSVHTCIMDMDSGGGAARGCFETARTIRKMADEAGIKLIAYTETLAASAAYALPAIADEFIATADADIGSIGVITQLVNVSKKLEEDGIEVKTFKSGAKKDTGSPYREMTDSEAEEIQARIDLLAEEFFQHVSEFREMSIEDIKNLEAGVFMGNKALELGLIDKVMTPMEFQNYLADISDTHKNEGGIALSLVEDDTTLDLETNDIGEEMSKETEAQVSTEDLQAQLANANAELAQHAETNKMLEEANAKLVEAQTALRQNEIDALASEAQAWSQFGLDSKEYAELAIDADAKLVEMVSGAFATAVKAIDESKLTEEIGDTTDEGGKAESLEMQKLKEKYNKG